MKIKIMSIYTKVWVKIRGWSENHVYRTIEPDAWCFGLLMANLLLLIDAKTMQSLKWNLKKTTMKVTLLETVTERFKFASWWALNSIILFSYWCESLAWSSPGTSSWGAVSAFPGLARSTIGWRPRDDTHLN